MTGYLEESPGEKSFIRLILLLAFIGWFALLIFFAVQDTWTVTKAGLITGILTIITGAKIWQKKYE